jgi:S-DNA-T family DNA segregation ATPase FtsK/SpoIIIE
MMAVPPARVVALRAPRSWLAHVPGVEVVEDLRVALTAPAFVLVDDAEGVDDADGALASILDGASPGVHVVAAGRSETLRGLYGHWTRAVRRSRLGILLRPQLDLDGELLATPLPRRVAVPMVAGRGFLVADGQGRLVQLAGSPPCPP